MTTPPPEAIEAVAKALFECERSSTWDWLVKSDPVAADMWRERATAALSAAAPFIAAQAKAEALREAADAADDPSPDEMDFYQIDQAQVGSWLRARAATIEGAS